jgi:hypothetical protein
MCELSEENCNNQSVKILWLVGVYVLFPGVMEHTPPASFEPGFTSLLILPLQL